MNEAGGGGRQALAEQLIARLDAAGIQRALVLSTSYWFAGGEPAAANELASVRAEHDWLAQQVARYPGRLVGFCSLNPLRDYALAELSRCAGELRLTGIKLHLGDSRIDLLDAGQAVFAEAAAAGDPRMKNVYFDVATIVTLDESRETLAVIAGRIRQLGPQRVLFGSDYPAGPELTPKNLWAAFRTLPLTDAELRTIAGNVPPHMR